MVLCVAYDAPGWLRMGGNRRRVRRKVWFGSCAELVVVGLAGPCTAIWFTAPKKYWL